MTWYHVFECDNTVKNPFVCDYSNLEENGYNKWDFLSGEKISEWKDNIIFQAKKKKNDGNTDDALQNAEMLPVFSERLINTLHSGSINGIQFLKVKVLRPSNVLIKGFCIANFLNFIEALDLEKSKYERFRADFPNPNVRGQISGITKYVLKRERLLGLDIIRLADYQQSFFVSEKFKDLFEKNKFTGYSFEEVELT